MTGTETPNLPSADQKRHAPATLRNRDAILAALKSEFPAEGLVLEVASGSGEHAAYLTPKLPEAITWQPTDADPGALASIDAHALETGCDRIKPAIHLDASKADWPLPEVPDMIFCANMIHIAPWEAGLGLLEGGGKVLQSKGLLALYGPFRRDGAHVSESNADFEGWLKAQDPRWGVRDLEGEVLPAAAAAGLALWKIVEMPANNLIVILQKESSA